MSLFENDVSLIQAKLQILLVKQDVNINGMLMSSIPN